MSVDEFRLLSFGVFDKDGDVDAFSLLLLLVDVVPRLIELLLLFEMRGCTKPYLLNVSAFVSALELFGLFGSMPLRLLILLLLKLFKLLTLLDALEYSFARKLSSGALTGMLVFDLLLFVVTGLTFKRRLLAFCCCCCCDCVVYDGDFMILIGICTSLLVMGGGDEGVMPMLFLVADDADVGDMDVDDFLFL